MSGLPAVVSILQLGSGTLSSSAVIPASMTAAGVATTIGIPISQIATTIGVPVGGGTGQILNKVDGSNFSAQWSNITQFVAVGTGLATSGSATSIVAAFARQSALSVLGVAGNATLEPAAITGTTSQFLGVNAAGTALAFQTMTGDASLSGPTLTIAKIAGVSVGTPTGTGNVVFSNSPTLAGTLTAGPAARFGTVTGQQQNAAYQFGFNGQSGAALEFVDNSTTGKNDGMVFTVNAGTKGYFGATATTMDVTAVGQLNLGAGNVVGAVVIDTSNNVTATGYVKGAGLIATGDPGGTASANTVSNISSTTISSGTGTIKMSSVNTATNAVWVKIYAGATAYWVPGWTTNSP